MSNDRFQGLLVRTPPTQESACSPGPFVMCPVAMPAGQGHGWQQVYQLAFAQAQAVVKPSIVDRLEANLLN